MASRRSGATEFVTRDGDRWQQLWLSDGRVLTKRVKPTYDPAKHRPEGTIPRTNIHPR